MIIRDVGLYNPNQWGFFEHGNVWEWVLTKHISGSYIRLVWHFTLISHNTLGFRLPTNKAPTNLNSTAPLTIAENKSAPSWANSTPPIRMPERPLTYHFANGAGDGNNSFFSLETNGTLKTATTFDYETNVSTYSIRVQVQGRIQRHG